MRQGETFAAGHLAALRWDRDARPMTVIPVTDVEVICDDWISYTDDRCRKCKCEITGMMTESEERLLSDFRVREEERERQARLVRLHDLDDRELRDEREEHLKGIVRLAEVEAEIDVEAHQLRVPGEGVDSYSEIGASSGRSDLRLNEHLGDATLVSTGRDDEDLIGVSTTDCSSRRGF